MLQRRPHALPPWRCFIGQQIDVGLAHPIGNGAGVHEVHLDFAHFILPDHDVAGQQQPPPVDRQITLMVFDRFTGVISLDRIECG